MRTVYKYDIEVDDRFTLELPKGAEILKVDMQDNTPRLWALVNPKHPTEKREFRFAGTGHPIEEKNIKYINTFFTVGMLGNELVFHIFEILKGE